LSVAELTLCFMLGLCHNVFSGGHALRQGLWRKDGGRELSGQTLGIVGCGHVGSEVLRLLAPFGNRVLINDIVDKSELAREYGAETVSFEALIERADVITLHVPQTPLTLGFIDAAVFERMKPTAYLINTSRGPVVDEAALKAALKGGSIAGAALDVFGQEPPTDAELLALPNLMGTPHIGGNTREAVEAMGRSAISHLIEFFHGEVEA
jgi:D-3-phosphoglycerate dehydrogenase